MFVALGSRSADFKEAHKNWQCASPTFFTALTTHNFWLFLKVKRILKVNHFKLIEDRRTATSMERKHFGKQIFRTAVESGKLIKECVCEEWGVL